MAVFFAVSPACSANFNLYIGGTHSHTSISDGSLLPKDAYNVARHQGKTDFWFITEHYQSLGFVATDPEVAEQTKEWDYELAAGKEFTEEGEFLALVGWEWSDSETGHMNVLFDESEPPAMLLTGMYETFISNWLRKKPQSLTGFNHPLWSEVDAGLDNFHDFEFNPKIARQVVYMEISSIEEVHYFYRALDKGWWIAPLSAQDNHSPDWGIRNEFVCVYAEKLDKASLREAFEARRFYATTDRNIQLNFTGNGKPMGSRLDGENLNLQISFAHANGVVPKLVRIVSNNATVVTQWEPKENSFHLNFETNIPKNASQWFVAYIENDDGSFALSAPIIVKNSET